MEKLKKINPALTNALIYGGIAAGLYIVWFLIMRAFGLHDNFRLRYLNFPILFACTYVCLNRLHKATNYTVSYLGGLAQSMMIAGVSVVLYGVFFFIYLKYIDQGLMTHLIETAPFGWLMTPALASFWVGHELFGFQVLFSIIVMEYFKFQQNKRGTLQNINMAHFAERPARKLWGMIFLVISVIALVMTFASLINPTTYPHISGLLRIDTNHLWRISWAPVVAALSMAFAVINLSEFNRRRRIYIE
jgi:hypothetical protein